jgi:hypothetical protein
MSRGFRKGDRIRHPRLEEWGVGEVLENGIGGTVRAFFVGAGERKLSLAHVRPELVQGEEAAHPVLDNLMQRAAIDKSRYKGIEQSRQFFLGEFPDGFHGERYLDTERNYKDKAARLAAELFDRDESLRLLKAGDHGEICARARKLVNATNLIFPNEKMALKDGLAEAEAEKDFARTLLALLFGEAAIERRFTDFVRVLERIDAAKWTTATYFSYFVHPQEHMFVKPIITQHAAEVCGFEINYKPLPNWGTYSAVLRLSRYLYDELAALKPRDLIDVQSFMWCVAPGKY